MKQEKAPGMTCTLGDCPMYRDCVAERLDCAAWAALAAERAKRAEAVRRCAAETRRWIEADEDLADERAKVADAVAVLKSRDDLDGWPGVVEAAIFILTAGKGKAEPPLTAAQVQAWLTAQVERAEASGHDDLAVDLAQAKLLIRRAEEGAIIAGENLSDREFVCSNCGFRFKARVMPKVCQSCGDQPPPRCDCDDQRCPRWPHGPRGLLPGRR